MIYLSTLGAYWNELRKTLNIKLLEVFWKLRTFKNGPLDLKPHNSFAIQNYPGTIKRVTKCNQ